MRRCPSCGQVYSDQLLYCLQDGTSLLDDQSVEETATVIRPKRNEAGRRSFLKYALLGLVGLLGIAIASALGAYLVWHWLSSSRDENAQSSQPESSTTPQNTPTPRPATPSPTQNTARIESPTPGPRETPKPADGNAYEDHGTLRINFRRGRVSETVSGRVAMTRSFVLRTMAGQYLNASIASDEQCVVFSNGAPSISFPTSAGDSRLDVRNNCGQPARFRLTVTVR